MQKEKESQNYLFSEVASLIGSKWRLLIMIHLRVCPWRFNELQKTLKISQKVLTENLRAMEADGIITRTVYPEVPPKVEYSLSGMGESMLPILGAIEQWTFSCKKSENDVRFCD